MPIKQYTCFGTFSKMHRIGLTTSYLEFYARICKSYDFIVKLEFCAPITGKLKVASSLLESTQT